MSKDSDCHAFFVYGTLRYDDNTNKEWTNIFNKNAINQSAILYGAVMYQLDQGYPAIIFKEGNYPVIGYRVTFDNIELWNEKLIYADSIEEYPDSYKRKIVQVTCNRNNEIVKLPAWVYYKDSIINGKIIEDGNWVKNNSFR